MGKTILVIDDAPMIRQLVKSVLSAEGHTVLEAADGEEAMRIARENTIHMAIVDIFLPKKGGLQVMGELMDTPAPPLFIAISGGEAFDPEAIVDLAKAFDVIATFTKPLDTTKLVEAVRGAFSS